MKRREFSAAAAWPPPAGRASLAPAARAGPAPEEGTDYLALDKPRAGRGAGRQDRGGRVLLVQLPALQRLRAGAGGLDQEGCRPTWCCGACRSAFGDDASCRSSACSTRSRPWASSTSCTARCSRPSTRKRQRARQRGRHRRCLGREAGPGQGQVPGAVQLVLGRRPRRAARRSCRTPTRSTACRRSASPGRYYTDGRAWPAAWTRALQVDRLPDRRGAQGRLSQTARGPQFVACAAAGLSAGAIATALHGYNRSKIRASMNTSLAIPPAALAAAAAAGRRRAGAPKRPTAPSR